MGGKDEFQESLTVSLAERGCYGAGGTFLIARRNSKKMWDSRSASFRRDLSL